MPFAMNRLPDNDLDRLFAEKLDDLRVEPPERSWKKVAAGITITTTVSTTALSNLLRPFFMSITGITTVVVLSVFNPSSDHNSQPSVIVRELLQPEPALADNQIIYNPGDFVEEPDALQAERFDAYIQPVVQMEEPVAVVTPEPDITDIQELLVVTEIITPADPMSYLETKGFDFNTFSEKAETKSFALDLTQPASPVIPYWFDLSLQAGADRFDFGEAAGQSLHSFASNTGLDLSFHFSDFYLQTGANLINMAQKNEYNYMMNEYQQVGNITLVDSITIIQSVDTAGQIVLTPQYYTSSHAVYDSVETSHSSVSNDHYRYMEIPLAFGFQKDMRHISVYAQTGFSYSFLINAKEISASQFEAGSGQHPLSWQPIFQPRAKDFWSYNLKAGIMYNTNSHFSIGLEPTYRYILNPLYTGEDNSASTPVSYGLRLRLFYRL